MNPYLKLTKKDYVDIIEVLEVIIRERRNDIKDFDNLNNRFILGRKVGKIPTGAADVDPTDRVGDMNYDASYLYLVIENAGTAEWRRVALQTW